MKTRRKTAHRGRPPLELTLSKADRLFLRRMLSKGQISVRVFKRARTLLLLDEGKTTTECAEALGIGRDTARRIANRYLECDLETALYELPRAGVAKTIDEKIEARIVAMICSKAPDGFSRWSLRIIVEEAINRGIIETVSEETIRRIMHRHELKPWREKNVVRGRTE